MTGVAPLSHASVRYRSRRRELRSPRQRRHNQGDVHVRGDDLRLRDHSSRLPHERAAPRDDESHDGRPITRFARDAYPIANRRQLLSRARDMTRASRKYGRHFAITDGHGVALTMLGDDAPRSGAVLRSITKCLSGGAECCRPARIPA